MQFGVNFGAHTCTHPILSKITFSEALYEIKASKRRLEEMLQKEIRTFCYPNGAERDFNDDIKNILRDNGFSCATSMLYGMNDLLTDPFALRRIPLSGRSLLHFHQDISGFELFKISLRQIWHKSDS